MSLTDNLPFFGDTDPMADLGEYLRDVRGDADALAMMPYDDGTFWLKKAHFDKELIGGMGGYETEDGDKIALDGKGEAVRSLMGVDVLLACDPTEHAAAIDPMKATVAHKNNIGEWLKVDKRGNVIEAGDAVTEVSGEINVGYEGTMVQEVAEQEGLAFDAALKKLEKQGDVTKIYDIAPPADVTVDDDGGLDVEQATHIAVNQTDAADLLPTTTSTTELNTALDKARMEEHEEGKFMTYVMYGIIIGAVLVGFTVVVMFLLTSVL